MAGEELGWVNVTVTGALKLFIVPKKCGEDNKELSEAGETSDILALIDLIHVNENRIKNENDFTYSSPVSNRNFVGVVRYIGLTRVIDASTILDELE